MRILFLIIFSLFSYCAFSQTQPYYITKWVRLYQDKMQYDSLRNGTWVNIATEGYAQGVGGGGGSQDLQSVMDNGATTTVDYIMNNSNGISIFKFLNENDEPRFQMFSDAQLLVADISVANGVGVISSNGFIQAPEIVINSSSFAGSIQATLSGNRTYTLQDASGTVAFLSDIDTTVLSTRGWRDKGIDSVVALINAIGSPTFQDVLTAGSTLTSNNDVTGSFRMGFGTSLSRIAAFNAYASGNININASGINTIQASTLAYVTAPSLLLEGTSEFKMTGSAISNIGVDTTTYKMLVIDNSGNVKKSGYPTSSLSGALVVSLTDASTISVDASLGYVIRSTYTVTLGGNRTMDEPSNPTNGQVIVFRIRQDAMGGRTITWDSVYRFSSDIPQPTLSSAANYVDYVAFQYNSADDKWDVIGVNIGLQN